jgi:hypothetical protein
VTDSYLHYATGWIIRPGVDYNLLTHAAAHAGCELVALAPIRTTERGFAVLTFAVRTTDEAYLMHFIQESGAAIGLTDWSSVPAEVFASGQALYLDLVPEEMRTAWISAQDAFGKHNEELLRKLDNPG